MPAFALPSIIVHLPHASVCLPEEERSRFLLSPAQVEHELLRMTDRYTDELFSLPSGLATPVTFPVSRLVVDPERFSEDEEEPMALRGMGAVYTKTSSGRPLRPPLSLQERERLMSAYYWPHHRLLEDRVQGALTIHRRCLILDAHSFPSQPLPCDLNQKLDRPDFCLGTDSYHTPIRLVRDACRIFEERGWRVSIDQPYSGTLVPSRFYRRDSSVASLMIEVNRKLYMNEADGSRLPTFPAFQEALSRALQSLAGIWTALDCAVPSPL